MRDFITLEEGKYYHLTIVIRNENDTQEFQFSQNVRYTKDVVKVRFTRKIRLCVSESEIDDYTPEDAKHLLDTLLDTGKWRITFNRYGKTS